MHNCLDCTGITPARAGKTNYNDNPIDKWWDHPRSCGKDVDGGIHLAPYQGSPPLVRERPYTLIDDVGNMRITPARAGKTYSSWSVSANIPDHPRSCGKDIT